MIDILNIYCIYIYPIYKLALRIDKVKEYMIIVMKEFRLYYEKLGSCRIRGEAKFKAL